MATSRERVLQTVLEEPSAVALLLGAALMSMQRRRIGRIFARQRENERAQLRNHYYTLYESLDTSGVWPRVHIIAPG